MVEYVEERLLRLRSRHPFLYVVDDEHVDCLVEIDEVVRTVLKYGVGVLHLEKPCADVKHPFLWVQLLCAHADGVD